MQQEMNKTKSINKYINKLVSVNLTKSRSNCDLKDEMNVINYYLLIII